MKNADEINKQFYSGLDMLDNGRYVQAIQVYDNLIPKVEDYNGDEETRITLETAFNNRGCAKCKAALEENNLNLYESGVDDFKKSIEISEITDQNEVQALTAWSNLQFAIKEMEYLRLRNEKQLKIVKPK